MDLRTALTQPLTLPLRLRRFLREGGGLDRVPDDLRAAIATRASRFLDIVERHVYGRPRNPYRKLLAHAGCELGDLRLIEEEAADGRSRLTLRVHPAVGPLDEARVLERLTEELGRAGRAQSFMTGVWRGAGTLSIERKPPRASLRGKTLPVHFAVGRES